MRGTSQIRIPAYQRQNRKENRALNGGSFSPTDLLSTRSEIETLPIWIQSVSDYDGIVHQTHTLTLGEAAGEDGIYHCGFLVDG